MLRASPATLGDEVQVREILERFPVERLERLEQGVGVERLLAFIGSDIYGLEITAVDGDYQEQYHRSSGTPHVVTFFDELGE